MDFKSQFKFLIVLMLLINLQHFANGQSVFCFKDSDCQNSNCVFFLCKPQGCRVDTDCDGWGYVNYYCFNQKAPFLGTQCKPKQSAGAICFGANECAR